MGRPRDPATPVRLQHCEVHGLVDFRLHRVGIVAKTGKQKLRWRCPACHTERNRA